MLKRTSELDRQEETYDARKSTDPQFSPNKLRSQIERSYRDVVVYSITILLYYSTYMFPR